jgi:hypothetical protein
MEVILLLAMIIGAPILIVGGVQILIWTLLGSTALRIVSALIVLICAGLLINEALLPPVLGNKSALIGLGSVAVGMLMVENLLIVCAPLMRHFVSWEKSVEARWAADQSN